MKGRHFSWINFAKFVLTTISVIIWIWLIWSFFDINLHNLKPNDEPSKYNAFVIYCDLLETAKES